MGNAFVTGSFTNTIAFGSKTLLTAGGSDLFLAKIGPTGTFLPGPTTEYLWHVD